MGDPAVCAAGPPLLFPRRKKNYAKHESAGVLLTIIFISNKCGVILLVRAAAAIPWEPGRRGKSVSGAARVGAARTGLVGETGPCCPGKRVFEFVSTRTCIGLV